MAKQMSSKTRKWILLVVAIAAALFIIAGIFRGEIADIYVKGANICMECIGLGQ